MAKDKILIVDDNKTNLKLMSQMLEKSAFEVNTAVSGEECFKNISELKPDLILLDIVMPNMDGYEVCKQLKKNKNTSNIPVIFLSAKKDPADKVKGLSLGAVDYITKPFDAGEVVARVKSQLKFLKLHRQLLHLASA